MRFVVPCKLHPEPNRFIYVQYVGILAAAEEVGVDETKAWREASKPDVGDVRKQKRKKERAIGKGSASQQQYEEYSKIVQEEREIRKRFEESAARVEFNNHGRYHQYKAGTGAFYKRLTPSHAAQSIARAWRRDWSNPSNPQKRYSEGKELPDCSDGEAIADEFAAYYKALFEIKETDEAAETECLATLEDGAKVLQPTATRCGEDITETEVYDTCMHLPYGKSPGPDRIHNALYRTHATTVAKILAEVFTSAREEGRLSKEVKSGLISVLYKKGEREDYKGPGSIPP